MTTDEMVVVPWWGWLLMAVIAAGMATASIVAIWLWWAVIT